MALSDPNFKFAFIGLIVVGVIFLLNKKITQTKGLARIGNALLAGACVFGTQFLLVAEKENRIWYAGAAVLGLYILVGIIKVIRGHERIKVRNRFKRQTKILNESLDHPQSEDFLPKDLSKP
ncbi:MAG: hypothetical protein KKF46_00440 [Nanoarchaeota archaeon]|nr:hypothetical protein [Nanoarchaeota archaeon]MBU1320802.1 hypothetical protein [Nanoarchaeota archaeon]MBU1596811.1 hypothetical protein [Nanoarchaeota archaeon]MBU2440881.1 hypothetical protein [Nanoarchaeota archaeon]